MNIATPQPPVLKPYFDALKLFAEVMFRNANRKGYVSFRVFEDNGKNERAILFPSCRLDDPEFYDLMLIPAERAATWYVPAVFAPPVCTFKDPFNAKTDNIFEGVVISVDGDAVPGAAQKKLETLIGEATIVNESGGEWINEETGEIEPKVHLHWRLKKPASGIDELAQLYEARSLAAQLVGADPTAKSIVHPLRWPGSWHRKKQPRLARIVSISEDAEIDLGEALALLRKAAIAEGLTSGNGPGGVPGDRREVSSSSLLTHTLSAIPNLDPRAHDWEYWNLTGMTIWASTSGSEEGRLAFHEWSAKSPKYDEAATETRWKHYFRSPPSRIGFGSLVYRAREANPEWQYGDGLRLRDETREFLDQLMRDHDEPDDNAGGDEAKDDPARGVNLEDFVAYMPKHNYIFRPSREAWPSESVNARIPPVKLFNSNGAPLLNDKGKPVKIAASTWLDKNAPVEQVTWAPGEPELIKDRLVNAGGWIERPDCSVFNLYMPPTLIHGDATKAGRWRNHVVKVYGDDSEHIILWLAHRVQHPGVKINHGIVMGGAMGIGKDTILEPVKRAIGPWNFSEVSPSQIMGRFTGHIKSVILRVSEARDSGDVDRYKLYDHMKSIMAAPPDVLRVDEKNIKEHDVFNVCGVILTTNYKTNGIYLPADDRRHFVAWSELTREDFLDPGPNPNKYWDDLWAWFDAGGDRDVAAYLATLDISGFNPKAPPPKTTAFWAIVDANKAPEESELADALDKVAALNGDVLPNVVTLFKVAQNVTSAGFKEWLEDRKNRRQIPHRMESCGYVPVRNPSTKDGLWVVGGVRQVIYAKKTLSVRDAIAAAQAYRG